MIQTNIISPMGNKKIGAERERERDIMVASIHYYKRVAQLLADCGPNIVKWTIR